MERLSDLEFDVLSRFYNAAPPYNLSHEDLFVPVGLQLNEYSSVVKVLVTKKLVEQHQTVFHLSDNGLIEYLSEVKLRNYEEMEEKRRAEQSAHQLERERLSDEQARRENRREWFAIFLSNLFSLAALIVAIISLCR